MKTKLLSSLHIYLFICIFSAFLNIYLPQPILPILQKTFSVDSFYISLTISSVIFGMTLSNLPIGHLSDKYQTKYFVILGGSTIFLLSVLVSISNSYWLLIISRFIQGASIPAVSTCLISHLTKTLPDKDVHFVVGTYISATVLGGMGGRLVGLMLYPYLGWRATLLIAGILIFISSTAVFIQLNKLPKSSTIRTNDVHFIELLTNTKLNSIYLRAMTGFAIFSSVFHFLPFRMLSNKHQYISDKLIIPMYLTYTVGVFSASISSYLLRLFSQRNVFALCCISLSLSLLSLFINNIYAIFFSLLVLCASFFIIHSISVASLNKHIVSSYGKANALYTVSYYLGGWIGITISSIGYKHGGWSFVIFTCLLFSIMLFRSNKDL